MYGRYDDLRRERGLSNYQVAKATGISQSTLSDWKNGKSTPKNDKLLILAEFFGVSMDYLLGLSNDSEGNSQDSIIDDEDEEMSFLLREVRELTPEERQSFKELFDYLKWRAKERKKEER